LSSPLCQANISDNFHFGDIPCLELCGSWLLMLGHASCVTCWLDKSSTQHCSQRPCFFFILCKHIIWYEVLNWCFVTWFVFFSWWSDNYLRKSKVWLPEYFTSLHSYYRCETLLIQGRWQMSLIEDLKQWTRMTHQIWGFCFATSIGFQLLLKLSFVVLPMAYASLLYSFVLDMKESCLTFTFESLQ